LLLEHKADVNSKDDGGQTALHRAANKNRAVIQLLLEHKADIDSKENDGQTAIDLAVKNEHDAVARLLLEHGAQLNSTTAYNLGILHKNKNNLEEAGAMFKKALTGFEEMLGLYHKSTLDVVNQLGILYREKGRLKDAEAVYSTHGH